MPTNDLARALADLRRSFAAVGCRWFVFGAQAVTAAGAPRLTADIDVTVEEPVGGSAALVGALEAHGFALQDIGEVASFIAETRVIPLSHRKTGLPVDVVIAGSAPEHEMLDRAKVRRVGRVGIPFIEVNDLVALKVLAGREKDLLDARTLIRAKPKGLDRRVVRRRLVHLGALIDDSSLVRTFDDLVSSGVEPRGRAPSPRKRASRRR